jgi:hypothetical protein
MESITLKTPSPGEQTAQTCAKARLQQLSRVTHDLDLGPAFNLVALAFIRPHIAATVVLFVRTRLTPLIGF